jgi:hypothetical protein
MSRRQTGPSSDPERTSEDDLASVERAMFALILEFAEPSAIGCRRCRQVRSEPYPNKTPMGGGGQKPSMKFGASRLPTQEEST